MLLASSAVRRAWQLWHNLLTKALCLGIGVEHSDVCMHGDDEQLSKVSQFVTWIKKASTSACTMAAIAGAEESARWVC